jgi:hypothetical protein
VFGGHFVLDDFVDHLESLDNVVATFFGGRICVYLSEFAVHYFSFVHERVRGQKEALHGGYESFERSRCDTKF